MKQLNEENWRSVKVPRWLAVKGVYKFINIPKAKKFIGTT